MLLAVTWNLRRLEPVEVPVADDTLRPRYVLSGAKWTRYDAQGQQRFSVQADLIEYFDDESATLTEIDARLPGGDESRWTLLSPGGRVPAGERLILLTGPVTGRGLNDDGEPLDFETPELWLDPEQQTFRTEAGVHLRSPGFSGTAKGLLGNWQQQSFQLLGNVRMDYARR